MFAATIQVECISFYEPAEGVWREEAVNVPTRAEIVQSQEYQDEDFEAFCRRSLL